MKSMTGFWGASLLKGLMWIIGSIILIVIIIILIVTVFKVCIRKVITTLVSVKSTDFSDLYPIPPWIAPYDDEDDDELENCI